MHAIFIILPTSVGKILWNNKLTEEIHCTENYFFQASNNLIPFYSMRKSNFLWEETYFLTPVMYSESILDILTEIEKAGRVIQGKHINYIFLKFFFKGEIQT